MKSSAIKHPLNLASQDFITNQLAYYRWLREEAPVYRGRMSVLRLWFVSRYDDCVALLKDERFVRNRTTATGGGRLPFPLPKSTSLLIKSMIVEDGVEHRRLRNLVHQAFTPSRLRKLQERIERLSHELLDRVADQSQVDLMTAYARPIPVTVIGEMVGVSGDDVPLFARYIQALATGFSGWRVLRALFWDLPRAGKFARELIRRKRTHPGDDILTGLIEAEENGDQLSEDELVGMVFLLIMAGHETTVHLITNAVQTLLTHPDQLQRLQAEPTLLESAVEEIMRFNGPIHATKPGYALEDVTLHGVTIPQGAAVMPLIGAANHDPTAFENPETFDIARAPNKHLGFGHGIHYCLGAPLARMETQIALRTLFDRYPNLRLAIPAEKLKLQFMPGWHRYESLPVQWQ